MKTSKLNNQTVRVNLLANIFLTIGILGAIFSGYLIYQRYNPQKLSFDINYEPAINTQSQSTFNPSALKIESANILLPIIPAQIKNNHWEATIKGVSYLNSTVLPGEQGNSILYGHNWPNLLGNLKKVKTGDRITITYQDNSTKDFLIEYISEVDPSQTSILNNSKDTRITLYTCSGFLDSKRLVVVAKLLV